MEFNKHAPHFHRRDMKFRPASRANECKDLYRDLIGTLQGPNRDLIGTMIMGRP